MRNRPMVLLTILALTSCFACGTGSAGSVSVLASWTGAEGSAFQKVLAGFTRQTGIKVDYRGTRALDQVLASDVQQGSAPDIAVLPNSGSMATYVRSGEVRPLDGILSRSTLADYTPQWRQLEKVGGNRIYAVPVKADLKSAIWYDPTRLHSTPRTWTDLVSLDRTISTGGGVPWCMGVGAPPTSGWPGTDWIEDILLHQSGTGDYSRWAAGQLAWTSSPVQEAWKTWGALVASPKSVRGGTTAVLLTDYTDAGRAMFTSPQGCSLEHEGSFIMGFYQGFRRTGAANPAPGSDFDYFPFPEFTAGQTGTAAEVSADLAGMFNDTPQARALIRYLASDKAQEIWPAIRGEGTFSVNKKVDLGTYRDPVSRRIARKLTSDDTLCFDASDLMPATMSNAFYRAVMEYLADPARLPTLLTDLDQVRQGVDRKEWLNSACGT